MKELYRMTKEELVVTCRRLQSENERLQDELDRLSDCYFEMENQLAANSSDEVNSILDVNHFKWRLQIDEIMTPQLESFIEDYLKFYNRKE
jgi:hypothetical protein